MGQLLTPEIDTATSLTNTFGAPPSDDLLTGGRLLRQAFHEAPHRIANRDEIIIWADEPAPAALLIHDGTAYSSHSFPDGKRAIMDIFLPTDAVGVEGSILGRPSHDIIAASTLGYRLMPAQTLRDLMADPRIAATALALVAEAKRRIERHVTALARLDAHGRLAAFLIGIYDRLRRADPMARPTFNLHLTQDQLGDHLGLTTVHINRTLRRMRAEQLAIVDRGIVIIQDVERLRGVAATAGLQPTVPDTTKDGALPSRVPAAADPAHRHLGYRVGPAQDVRDDQ